MKSSVSFLCTVLFAAVAGGATVEILTEGWTGSGVTNGWKFANLGTDGTMGAASYIESPKWTDADILSAMVNVRCSTNQPDRIPQITFCYDDALTARAIRLNPVTKDGRWESQAFDANPDRHAKGLRLALAENGTANWTVHSIVLDYEGSLDSTEPDHVPGFVIFIK